MPESQVCPKARNPRPAKTSLALTGNDEADALLATDPLALVIGMVLDQQIPLERAFRSPFDLKERLGGSLDPGAIASMDPDALAEIFGASPAALTKVRQFKQQMKAEAKAKASGIS